MCDVILRAVLWPDKSLLASVCEVSGKTKIWIELATFSTQRY